MPESRFVAYYRVSTRKQSLSGLGLDAQRLTVESFIRSRSGQAVAEFTEQESGRNTSRPELLKALSACRVHRAVLVVAKLDRLARNAAFLLSLRDASVEIVACDLPSMNRMTVGIMAVVAEEESRMIADRTRSAMAAAKRRGATFGTPGNLSPEARAHGSRIGGQVRAQRADNRALDLAPIVDQMRQEGCISLRQIANALTSRGIPSASGAAWSAMGVSRMLIRQRKPSRAT